MSVIDSRVVEMKFDHQQFISGVTKTLGILGKLQQGLKLDGATKGLEEVDKAGKRLDLSKIGDGVKNISDKFSAMSVVGITALTNITNKAVDAGVALVKSFTTDQIGAGLQEYEKNLTSIQTVLANTKSSGGNLKSVNDALQNLNTYSDKTIYNFSEMANNIGTFTAAGVKLGPATDAIKGIANLAAMSGSSSEQASTAMYQLSQAMAAGKVGLQDWNSVVNAGMGGKVFQNTLLETAKALEGNNEKYADTLKKVDKGTLSFRDSMQKGWITADVLSTALGTFTGDMTAAQMKAKGFSDAQIKFLQDQATTAMHAATEVKTASQLMDTLKEAAGSGWTQTWQIILGDFEEAKKLFTSINNVVSPMINNMSNARNNLLQSWKSLGGRDKLIQALGIAGTSLLKVLGAIGDAFKLVFPPATGKTLLAMTNSFMRFVVAIKPTDKQLLQIKDTFRGVFSLIDIGVTIVKKLFGAFQNAAAGISIGDRSFLDIASSIGQYLTHLDKMFKTSKDVDKFFNGLSQKIHGVLGFFADLINRVFHLDSTFQNLQKSKGFHIPGLDAIKEQLGKFSGLGASVTSIFNAIGDSIKRMWDSITPVFGKIGGFFKELGRQLSDIGNQLAEGFKSADFGRVLDVINVGLFGAIAAAAKKFAKKGSIFGDINIGPDTKKLEKLTAPFKVMGDTLKSFQAELKAKTLMELAKAIGLLTLSAVALSLLDSKKLATALAAMATMFVQLLGSLAAFEKMAGVKGFAKLPTLMAGLISFATAVDMLTLAVIALSFIDPAKLAQGIGGITAILALLVGTTTMLSGQENTLKGSALGFIALAEGVRILVGACSEFSKMSWADMAKGLTGVGALLAALGIFTKFSEADKGGVLAGAGLLLMAGAIKILADVVKQFGSMDLGVMGQGLLGVSSAIAVMTAALIAIPPSAPMSAAGVAIMAAAMLMIGDAIKQIGSLDLGVVGQGILAMASSLGIIAGALALLPPSSLLSAAAIFIAASAVTTIGQAMQQMGSMDMESIGKAVLALGASLGILAGALLVMNSALPGAAALVVAAGALSLITPVLTTLGSMSWEQIGAGLAALAGAFTVIGVAGALLTPVVPTLFGFSAAVALLGVGLLSAGAGVLAFSIGLGALAGLAAKGLEGVWTLVKGLISMIPTVAAALAQGVIAFAGVIAASGGAIFNAMNTIFKTLISVVIANIPMITKLFGTMLDALIALATVYIPRLANAGLTIILGILMGIRNNIRSIVNIAGDIIVQFVKGIGDNSLKVINAAADTLIHFLNGLATAIRTKGPEINRAGLNIASAIIDGMTKGLSDNAHWVMDGIKKIAEALPAWAKKILGIASPSKEFIKIGQYVNAGFAKGIHGSKDQVKGAVSGLIKEMNQQYLVAFDNLHKAQAKLNKDMHAKHKDKRLIAADKSAVAQAQKELNGVRSLYDTYNNNLRFQVGTLNALKDKHDVVAKRLEDANQKLADAIKTREDYRASVKDQFNNLPSISNDTTFADFKKELANQIQSTQEFTASMAKLRGMGLNDTMYQELMGKGLDALPMIRGMLASGKQGVKEINVMSTALQNQASKLGDQAANQLYTAAVNSAQGLVDGLKKQEAAIQAQMNRIADGMVNTLKGKLGIKSPSRVFAEIGKFSNQGLAHGLSAYSDVVNISAKRVGADAIESMRKSISGISAVVDDAMVSNPTITPVLDLSNVQDGAGQIGDILGSQTISPDASYASAKNAAGGYQANVDAAKLALQPASSNQITLVQNNTSPKALSAAEIYRQTKNQISIARGALTRP